MDLSDLFNVPELCDRALILSPTRDNSDSITDGSEESGDMKAEVRNSDGKQPCPKCDKRFKVLWRHKCKKGKDRVKRPHNGSVAQSTRSKKPRIESSSEPISLDSDDEVSESSSNGERKIHISSMVLASRSNYFKKMFLSGFAETKQKDIVIKVAPNEMEATYEAIKCAFTDKLPHDATVIWLVELIHQADKFDLQNVKLCVSDHIETLDLNLDECLLLLDLPESIREADWFEQLLETIGDWLESLFGKFSKVWVANGDKIVISKEFAKLSVPALKLILGSDYIQISSENNVFEALVMWEALKPGRTLDDLLPHIRFRQMSRFYLYIIRNSCKSGRIKQAINEALLYKSLSNKGRSQKIVFREPNNLDKPRLFKEKVCKTVSISRVKIQSVVENKAKRAASDRFLLFGVHFRVVIHRNGSSEDLFMCLRSTNRGGVAARWSCKISIDGGGTRLQTTEISHVLDDKKGNLCQKLSKDVVEQKLDCEFWDFTITPKHPVML